VLTLALGWRLGRDVPPRARRWFARTLLLSALSAFVGGSYHGLAPNFSPDIAAVWWRVVLIVLSFVSAALALSWMHEIVTPIHHRWMRAVIVIKLALFVTIALIQPAFLVAIADYGTALLAWLVAALVLRRPWRAWMLTAIGLSAAAAAIQQLRLSPSPHFNHNDLYHVVQGVAFVAFYRAGRMFGRKIFKL
ncbi:MAG TPA: hypothetical protein VL069_13175, partial [Opitutus sp.]|nr:hypothetical protein [Opitutus sp.]